MIPSFISADLGCHMFVSATVLFYLLIYAPNLIKLYVILILNIFLYNRNR